MPGACCVIRRRCGDVVGRAADAANKGARIAGKGARFQPTILTAADAGLWVGVQVTPVSFIAAVGIAAQGIAHPPLYRPPTTSLNVHAIIQSILVFVAAGEFHIGFNRVRVSVIITIAVEIVGCAIFIAIDRLKTGAKGFVNPLVREGAAWGDIGRGRLRFNHIRNTVAVTIQIEEIGQAIAIAIRHRTGLA